MMMEIIEVIVTCVIVTAGTVWGLYKFYYKKNLEGNIKERVEKEINKHYLNLGHQFARKMADYDKYVDKKHVAYSTMSEKMTLVQGLLNNEENFLSNLGKDKIKEFLQENDFINYGNIIKAWSDAPEHEKDKKYQSVKKVNKFLRSLVLGQIIPEMHQYYYVNKIYFTCDLCNKIEFLIKEMDAFRTIKFIWDDKTKTIHGVNTDVLIANINQYMEEIIKLMRNDLSGNK